MNLRAFKDALGINDGIRAQHKNTFTPFYFDGTHLGV